MSFIENKPYVWTDTTSGAVPELKIIVFPGHGLGLSVNPETIIFQTEGDTLFVIYKMLPGIGVPAMPVTLRLDGTSTYDSDVHDKVTVMLCNERDDILGFQTVKPVAGVFSTSGKTPPPIPHLWLFCRRTDSLVVNVATDIQVPAIYSGAVYADDFTLYRRTITFTFTKNAKGTTGMVPLEFPLDYTNDFDPVLEDIVVEVVVNNADGSQDRKGTGTTHSSEGDASGDD
jgi:hypothetical protein